MTQPYPEPVTAEQAGSHRPRLRLVLPLPEVEQDQRDDELRRLLAEFYDQTWALARARTNPPRRTP